jgi:hypothetical protein
MGNLVLCRTARPKLPVWLKKGKPTGKLRR